MSTEYDTYSYAKIVADTIDPTTGKRLTTMEARMRRFVLAEFNTHRLFSRNSASSRAIPLKKQLDRAIARPISFPLEQKGMSGGDELDDAKVEDAIQEWDNAAMDAVRHAKELGHLGVHKSVANRLLEPFLMHTVIVTATEWENFFDQRCSPQAQPEIREVAEMMEMAHVESTPDKADEDTWHLPYIQEQDVDEVSARWHTTDYWDVLGRISAARCARVSYLTHEGTRDLAEDLGLFEKLVTLRHWSPLEHVATPWPANIQKGSLWFDHLEGESVRVNLEGPVVGNLTGWRSLRTTVESHRNIRTLK